jgi:hypothetical protein
VARGSNGVEEGRNLARRARPLGLRRSGASSAEAEGARACVRRRGKQQREGRERARPVGRLWDLGGSSELNEKGKGEENSSHPEEPHRRRRRRRRRADSISFLSRSLAYSPFLFRVGNL